VTDLTMGSVALQGVAPRSAQESRLLSSMSTQEGLQDPGKIEKAAKDFESILLGHWLEEAQQSLGSAPGGEDDEESDPAQSQLQGLGMQSLATTITKSGGIGLASLISRQLHRLDNEAPGSPQPAGVYTRDVPGTINSLAPQPQKNLQND
jgi:Rod binding domain-containing protein